MGSSLVLALFYIYNIVQWKSGSKVEFCALWMLIFLQFSLGIKLAPKIGMVLLLLLFSDSNINFRTMSCNRSHGIRKKRNFNSSKMGHNDRIELCSVWWRVCLSSMDTGPTIVPFSTSWSEYFEQKLMCISGRPWELSTFLCSWTCRTVPLVMAKGCSSELFRHHSHLVGMSRCSVICCVV